MHQNSQPPRHLQLLSERYPTAAAAASEIIRIEALLRLPKGTEHFMSDLHGEHEAFVHILNSASGVIREKIDIVFPALPERERAELATLVYYPAEKLPTLKAGQADLPAWYRETLLRLIELCRFVSSKHTRAHVRRWLPEDCGYILDELLHAHFEDHDKNLYYGQIIESILRCGRADAYILRLCALIKRLAVDWLHIVGDIFDRGARPDLILDGLMAHHHADLQWGNHDVVWMGAAAGSPLCVMTVLKTTLAYGNLDLLERGYGISLRPLEHFARAVYGADDVTRWLPRGDVAEDFTGDRTAVGQMHKAVSILMFKLETEVMDRNPDFRLEGRDYLRQIDYARGTVRCGGREHPLLDCAFPTVDPADPAALTEGERQVLEALVRSFRESERLQRHARFLYSHGAFYKICNGNLLYHGAVPMTEAGELAEITFQGKARSGKALFDYCDRRARQGYFAPEGSPERQAGQDFLWYLWCGALSPLFGRSAMTTFERLYLADPATHTERKDPYYRHIARPETALAILHAFGLEGEGCHIVNGHVPVRAVEGESPVKGGGRLIVIDGGFCRAYHSKTGIAGYTLVYNSRGLVLRTHQPFEGLEQAIWQDGDIASQSDYIYTAPRRLLVGDTDEGAERRRLIEDLSALAEAYRSGQLPERGISL